MKRIVIFGNSGSGKSTMAKYFCEKYRLAHLDLDTLAWQDTTPPTRQAIEISHRSIRQFIFDHNAWVIEGCYSDLMSFAIPKCNEMYFMNLPIALCLENAKARPWEPHKYPTKQAQDDNLNMLLDWIKQYETRYDTFSLKAHQTLFNDFRGTKHLYVDNPSLSNLNVPVHEHLKSLR